MAGLTPPLSPVELLARLVAFDTVSERSNRAMIDWIADYLGGFGIQAAIAADDSGTKADLIATIGPRAPGGIILSGHSDVVPVAGQAWDTDPFRLTEKDGLLYGRGSADMKGFIAVALALVPEFLALKLAKPLHLVLSFDEELGCLGGPRLIRRYVKDFPEAHAAIVGEPTGMRLANAHKGVSVFRTRIAGKPGHSSDPDAGVNAIAVAAEAIRFLMKEADAMKKGPGDRRFTPPHATVSVGQIEGGTAINIIAGQCSFVWDCRSVTGAESAALEAAFEDHCALELLPPMREVAPDAAIHTERHASVPPLVAKDDNPAETLVRRLTGHNEAQVSSFASEAGMFQQAGIPAVLCGPGDIAQAHQPNEFVAVSQLSACGEFLRSLGRWCAGVAPTS